jgi:hypothetical protein
MTADEKRKKVVAKLKTRIGKNTYTQGPKRTQVGSGYGDCSATTRWAYLTTLNVDIGGNTEAQITSSKGKVVDTGDANGIPIEKNLKLGDLIYFRGTDDSRTKGVGHVEMYIGNGQCCGHGSGIGPTVKNMKEYCKLRKNMSSTAKLKNRGYICAKRFIADDTKSTTKTTTTTKKTTTTSSKSSTTKTVKATVTADNGLNVRSSKASTTKSNIVGKLTKGTKVTVVEKGSTWTTIKYESKNRYVATKYLKF